MDANTTRRCGACGRAIGALAERTDYGSCDREELRAKHGLEIGATEIIAICTGCEPLDG